MENSILSILAAGGGILLFSVIGYLFVAVIVGIQVYTFAITRCVKLPKLTLPPKLYRIFRQTDEWAEENGFHYVGIFRFQIMILAVWENPEKSTFLAQYLNFNGPYFGFETLFDNNLYIETGNVRDGMLLPTFPGYYMQHFPKKSLEELWELHTESVRYLIEYGKIQQTPFRPDFPWGNIPPADPFAEQQLLAFEIFQTTEIRNLCKYLRSLSLFPLRWGYWYFYRRFFWVHKTIQEQVEMGRLVLPQELPPDYEKYFVRWSPKKQLDGFEPIERTTLFDNSFDNSTTEIDAESLYSREYAVEPKTIGLFGKSIGWIFTLVLAVLCGILPLYWGISNYFGYKALKQVQQSLATQNFDEALEKADKIRFNHYKHEAITLVAKEYASVERYDNALKTASLLPQEKNRKGTFNSFQKNDLLEFIVSAKAADEQFDDLDEIIRQIDSDYYKNGMYRNIAVAQAKAGLMDDVEKTLEQLKQFKGDGIKNSIKLDIARNIFDLGRTDEAITLVKTIQDSEEIYDDKIMRFCEIAQKLVQKGDIETARQLLFDAVEIRDKFTEKYDSNNLLQEILNVFRKAGKPEEGLRFAQEMALHYPADDNKNDNKNDNENDNENKENEEPIWKLTPSDVVLCETAILNAELGNYAEGWKILESIPALFENFSSSLPYERDNLLIKFFHAGQKHGINMKTEIKHIEEIIKPAFEATVDPKTEIKLLGRLFGFQIAARCFEDAVTTAKRREKIKQHDDYPTLNELWERITLEQAKAGKIDDALETVKKLKTNDFIWQSIIIAEANADRFDEAIQHLSHCKDKSWREGTLHEMIKIRINKGQLTESEKMLELLKTPESKVDVLLSLAEANYESETKDVADRLVTQSISLMNQCLAPSWSEPKPKQFLRTAILLSKLGHFSEALIMAERISILSVPKRVTALRAIADAQTAAGKLDDAQTTRKKIRWRFAQK
ncbi:MAG: hypothetical protein LBP87_01850 [Planctomycetaceae bacterium]|jgi:predicted negative regulator of RcsB-dependent stress response|nr:hypothetical protein [Planctomycetaceae bacterium]